MLYKKKLINTEKFVHLDLNKLPGLLLWNLESLSVVLQKQNNQYNMAELKTVTLTTHARVVTWM